MATPALNLALYDAVTGLPNRALLADRLAHAARAAERDGDGVALLHVQVAGLERIGLFLGQAAGAEALKAVSWRLAACIRKVDTLARIDGEEFAVVLGGVRERRDAATVAARIEDTVGRPLALQGGQFDLAVTVGLALYPQDAGTPEALAGRASQAMQSGSGSGPNACLHREHAGHVPRSDEGEDPSLLAA